MNLDTRISLCELTTNDAQFILELVTQASFKEHIGDKGVTDLEGARTHLEEQYIKAYSKYGFGLWGIKDRELDCYVGVCGVVTRKGVETPDLGYALLDAYQKQGYVSLAAKLVIEKARVFGLEALSAFVAPENYRSVNVLTKLGFKYQGQTQLPGYQGVTNCYKRVL